jgi:hypothetical protein
MRHPDGACTAAGRATSCAGSAVRRSLVSYHLEADGVVGWLSPSESRMMRRRGGLFRCSRQNFVYWVFERNPWVLHRDVCWGRAMT